MDTFHRRDPLARDQRTWACPDPADIGQARGRAKAMARPTDVQIAGIANGRTDHRHTLPRPDGSNGR